nr:glycine cleavage T C-terminal barrel domain-containing protein [Shinella curvata]
MAAQAEILSSVVTSVTCIPCLHYGLMALESLRLEKGYRDFGVDIDNTDTPLEAGLGFVADFNKGDFVGRAALMKQKEGGALRRRLITVKLNDPEPLLLGGEPVIVNGVSAGYVRVGAFGHTLGVSVGLLMIERDQGLTAEFVRNSTFEIEVNDRHVMATASLVPFYDPKSERVRA